MFCGDGDRGGGPFCGRAVVVVVLGTCRVGLAMVRANCGPKTETSMLMVLFLWLGCVRSP